MPETSLARFDTLQTIVCCPASRSALSLLTASDLLERLPDEERFRDPEGTIGAFVSESSKTAYPIVGGIVDFLDQDCLRLSPDRPVEAAAVDLQSASIQKSVKQWYDEFGWLRGESGVYNDTALFSQESMTANGVYELASHVSLLDRLSGGDFVLDAASGPIAHPENLAYSWFYKYRVCVDLSLTALREAQAKLEGKGFCCMANICRLPFLEGAFDGIVSAYTIQHIAESQQSDAVAELYRVLKPRGHLCLIDSLKETRAHRTLLLLLRAIRKFLRLLTVGRNRAVREQAAQGSGSPKAPYRLYSHGRDLRWWRDQARRLTDSYALAGLRLLSKREFESLFGESMRAAKTIRALEILFPGLAARMCTYLLVDVVKPDATISSD